jgi:AcrR family transcriptional regulator
MSDIRFQKLRQRTESAFLRAALELILERGYDAVSVTDIVRLADYGRSTFYLHFRDKEDLVWRLLQNQTDQLDAQVMRAVEPLPSPRREYRAWLIIFETIDQQREFFLKMDGEFSRRLRQQQKLYLTRSFERRLQEGFYDFGWNVAPAIAARFVVGALLEILEYWLVRPDLGRPEEMARAMYQLVYRQEPEPLDGDPP